MHMTPIADGSDPGRSAVLVRRRAVLVRSLMALGLALCAWGLALARAQAGDPDIIEDSALVPVKVNGETVRLEMLFARARNAGDRLPVVLISHGKPSTRADMAAVHATNYRSIAQDFARRGWLAVAIVRRGYGLSEGTFLSAGNCRAGYDLQRQFSSEAEDLTAALAAVGARREADLTRILAIGASDGGMISLAFAATRPKGLKAVVNVSGGLRNRECPFEDQLVSVAKQLGGEVAVPSLWLYAENDSFFPPSVARRMEAAYETGRAPITFQMLPPLGDDGHRLFSAIEGRIQWWPEVDRFLRAQGLPTWPANAVDEMLQKHQIDAKHRPAVERYVSAPGEKAMVKGANGALIYWWAGAETTEEAVRKALANCNLRRGTPCQVVMTNQGNAPPATASGGNGAAKMR